MLIDLKLSGFPFFKVTTSFVFLLATILFPLFGLVSIFVIFFAKVHTLGAWVAMWRAKKLSWLYLSYVSVLIVGLSYFGVNVWELKTLAFLAFSFFAFHFVYDEYELQEERRTLENIVLMFSPLVILFTMIARDMFSVGITFSFFLAVALFGFLLEGIYVRKINWIFVSSKVIVLFLLAALYLGKDVVFILYTLLMYHYLFWLAFPIYKLHKYVKEDRDDFMMILILIVLMSAFIYTTDVWQGYMDVNENLTRTFYVASLVHVLSTAPFANYFGLRRKKYAG